MVVSEYSFRVVLADEIAPEGVRLLEQTERLQVDDRAGISAPELVSVIGGYDALIVRSRTKVTAEILEAGDRLKVVGRAGVGVDNIDVDAARRRGIRVLNAQSGNVISAAEHTLALMLALVRHIPQADASLRRGEWERSRFRGIELHGKTLGLLGAGRIGSEVARRAAAFGMQVVVYDPYLSVERAREVGAELTTLADLLERADLITVHVPLTDETRGLIGAEAIAAMKPTAYLINAARGGVVDEMALAAALESGKLAGAALDVFEEEPVRADHPLLSLENVVAVPHLGAATKEAQANSGLEICKAVRDALIASDTRSAVNVS
jgi:D-3-phosphoglycerate dehydrogenase